MQPNEAHANEAYMQQFAESVKPLPDREPCSELVDNFASSLEARILQALADHDYTQAARATLAHPAADSWPPATYDTIDAIADSKAPITSLEATAVELAAVAVLQGRAVG